MHSEYAVLGDDPLGKNNIQKADGGRKSQGSILRKNGQKERRVMVEVYDRRNSPQE